MIKNKLWESRDGHIFVKDSSSKKSHEFRLGKLFESHICIASNIGKDLADYITELHNNTLENK